MILNKSKKLIKGKKNKYIKIKTKRTKKNKKKSIKRGGGVGSSKIKSEQKIKTLLKPTKSPLKNVSTSSFIIQKPLIPIFNNDPSNYKYFTEVNSIEPFGIHSQNGFMYKLNYKNNSNALLKSSLTYDKKEMGMPDNLMYEYLVGQYINKLNDIYPCFIQTYDLYVYANNDTYERMKNKQGNPSDLTSLTISDKKLNTACIKGKHLALLIEYLPNIKSMSYMLKTNENNFLEHDIFTSLYQIYFVLKKLKNNFTHYDLHTDNVQIYKVPDNKYIHYYYGIIGKNVTSFKSKYLVKIIDYGHSYFHGSVNIYEEICNNMITPACNKKDTCRKCGYDCGFHWLLPSLIKQDPYISASIFNPSHDLLLLNYIKSYNPTPQYNKFLSDFLERIYYEDKYGTPPKKKENTSDNRIYTINDAKKALKEIIISDDFISENNKLYENSDNLLCTLIISGNESMDYLPK